MRKSSSGQLAVRKGFLYIAVLLTCLMVITTTVAAFSISTHRVRARAMRLDAEEATRIAEAEMRRVAAEMSTSATLWRENRVSGEPTSWRPGLDGAMVCTRVDDLDADLGDDPSDPVQVTCYAAVGQARRGLEATLEPVPEPMDSLRQTVNVSRNVNVSSAASLSCTGVVSVAGDIRVANNAFAWADRWLTVYRTGASVVGHQSIAERLPDHPESVVVKQYAKRGTAMNTSKMHRSGDSLQLRSQLLTASLNPLGEPNEEGIYWIDAGGRELRIADCRIAATLVVTGCKQVTLTSGVLWQAPAPGGVTLITTAPVCFEQTSDSLIESDASENFNPVKVPYRGQSDDDRRDRYQSAMEGVLYTSSTLRWSRDNPPNGTLLCGPIFCESLYVEGSMRIMEDTRSTENPPWGFQVFRSFRFVHGSLKTVAVPSL
jgi:hypothetical protein